MKQKPKKWLLPLLCYGLAALVWLGIGGVCLLRCTLAQNSGQMVRRGLSPLDFDDQFGLFIPDEYDEGKWFSTTDPDPQLILYFEEAQPVGRVVFSAKTIGRPAGEMVLYYTTKPGDGFSEEKKLWARQAANGNWYFDLDGRRVAAVRLDPDSVGGVHWAVQAIVLNEEKPAWQFFVPDAMQVALLLFAPLLGWAVLAEAWVFLRPFFSRRRFEARWRSEEDQAKESRKGASPPDDGKPARK